MLSSNEGDINDVFFDSADYLSPQESDLSSNELDYYEIWVNEPQSVKERRQRFLEGVGLSDISSKPSMGLERIRDNNNGAVPNVSEKETSEANMAFDEMQKFPEDEENVSFHENRHTEAEVQEGHGDLDMDKKKKKKKNWWERFVNKRKESGGEKIGSKLNKGANNKTHRIKVRQNKKRWMELSGLYVGQEIIAHNGIIWTMKFSPNGQFLATGGEDGVVRIWRVVLQDISSDCFNAEDNFVTKVKQDMFCSWKKHSGQNSLVLPNKVFQVEESPIQEFKGHSSDVLDLAWSNSEILLSSSMDKTVRLWQIGCDQCLSVFCHNDYVTCIQVNPVDENYFISGSIDGKVRIWGLNEERVVDWADIHEVITVISYKPDGKGFVVGSISGTCRFYITSDKHCRLEAQIHVDGKKRSRGNKISGIQFFQEKYHQRVLITSDDSKFCLLEGIDVVHKYRGLSKSRSQMSGSFTSSGKHIISVGEDSNVYVWNLSDLENPSTKHKKSTGFCEYFFSKGVVVAVPWSGMMSTDQMVTTGLTHCSSDLLQPQMLEDRRRECFSHSNWFSVDHTCRGGSVTWPEEKLPTWNSPSAEEDAYSYSHQQKKLCLKDPWGLSIVTASCDGIIKTFHNFGLPVRL